MSEPEHRDDAPLLKRFIDSKPGLVLFSLLGVFFVAVCARVEVPMIPVPMSLQTYAVLVIGAVAGPLVGGGTLVLYLVAGALGLPVFAGGASGFQHLTGNTAGYLVGFAVAATLVGFWTQRWAKTDFWRLTAILLLGHLVVLGLGAIWLGTKIGVVPAIQGGLLPFLLGGVVKSVLGAATVVWLSRLLEGRSSRAG